MKKYTKVKVIRITDIQHQTLKKMKYYKIDVGNFIREAIAQKIKAEYLDLIPKQPEKYCPF